MKPIHVHMRAQMPVQVHVVQPAQLHSCNPQAPLTSVMMHQSLILVQQLAQGQANIGGHLKLQNHTQSSGHTWQQILCIVCHMPPFRITQVPPSESHSLLDERSLVFQEGGESQVARWMALILNSLVGVGIAIAWNSYDKSKSAVYVVQV